jgi:hypothetical protein
MDDPRRRSLFELIATELHSARGQHVCTNAYPPTCNVDIAEQIMARVDRYADDIANPLRADLDNAERDNRRLADEVKRLEARLERARAEYEAHERAYDMVDGDLYETLFGTGGQR